MLLSLLFANTVKFMAYISITDYHKNFCFKIAMLPDCRFCPIMRNFELSGEFWKTRTNGKIFEKLFHISLLKFTFSRLTTLDVDFDLKIEIYQIIIPVLVI